MAKGGESLGNEESSEEEEEVIPALNHTPGVRPLAPGVVFLKDILLQKFYREDPSASVLMLCLREINFTPAL
jgi:hypothetical protein